jgi:eukaryotic-like serine/threonine-protein kinase
MPPMTGRVIAGRYILDQPIGRGAMGVVWRGRDQLLDREVAVKEVVLSSSIGADERKNAYQRTLREARTAARLSHRGVVTVFDVAEEDGRPWIVMELVPSRSLDQVLTVEKRLTPLRAGRIGQQLLAALAAAHAVGVLHRDVKPSNVLIARERSGGEWDERAVLTDFGIAQFAGDPRLTQTGMVMGSPGFTAPERIRGGAATPASDLWSLGATIYAAVEGSGPYERRGGAITTMSAIINEDAPVASSSGRLAPLIAALLRRDPSTRPSAAAAARMFADVLPLLGGAAAEPAHPETVMSAYVPPPAAPAASAAVEAAAGPAVDEAVAEPPGGPAEAAPAAVGNVAAGGLDAAGEKHADAEGAAVAAAALAGVGAAAAADVAVDEAVTTPVAPVTPSVAEPAPDPRPAAVKPSAAQEPGAEEVGAAPEAAAPEVYDPPAPEPPSAATSVDPVLHNLAPPKPRPSFSAAQPARTDPPVAPTPKPSYEPQPSYEETQIGDSNAQWRPGSGDQWGANPQWGSNAQHGSSAQYGSNAQYGSSAQYGSNAQYPGPNQQYAGPSQPYPDLAQEYAPGTVGAPRSRRGRKIALIVGAIVIAAAAGGGAALALRHPASTAAGSTANEVKPSPTTPFGSVNALNTPSTTLPSGWTTDTVKPSDTGTAGGFSIDVPPGWSETRSGLATHFDGPGGIFLEVDLTPHTYQNMVTEAQYIKQQSLAKGAFPGYKQNHLQGVPVRGTQGSFWQFTWTPANDVKQLTDDILFIMPTSTGPQSYAIYFRGPDSGWNAKFLPLFEQMLHTFQTISS